MTVVEAGRTQNKDNTMTSEYTNSSSDPFGASLDQINNLINDLLSRYSSLRPVQEPKPEEDPLIQGYLSQYLGGARSLLNSYTSQQSGSRTRGLGASSTGGSPLSESEAYHQALKTLASEYSSKFGDAVEKAKSLRAAQYSQQSSDLGSLNDLLLTRNKLLSAQGDWLNNLTAQQYEVERSRAQGNLQAQTTAERNAGLNSDREQAQLAQDQALASEDKWRSLQAKARLVSRIGKGAAGWTNADDMLSDRLGVEFGYYQPWSRKLEIRMGGSKR